MGLGDGDTGLLRPEDSPDLPAVGAIRALIEYFVWDSKAMVFIISSHRTVYGTYDPLSAYAQP
jgi:hypothetical protein